MRRKSISYICLLGLVLSACKVLPYDAGHTSQAPGAHIQKLYATEKQPTFKTASQGNIRVLLMSLTEISVSSTFLCEVWDFDEKAVLAREKTLSLRLSGNGIKLDGAGSPLDRIVILAAGGGVLSLNGKPYRGKVIIQRSAGGKMDVINVVELEAYLYGVVPKEMSPRWPLEALKAQAVASRTYAIYQKEKNGNKDYDLCATINSQVYGGKGVETERAKQAVDETSGVVLLYDGQLAMPYFHADSGGITEDPEYVWAVKLPHLKGIHDDYSLNVPNSLWELSLSLDEIRKALNEKGVEVGRIDMLMPVESSPSGRVSKIKVLHSGGETTMSGNDFRLKIGSVLLRSTLFSLTVDNRKVHFKGRGYGHGVGMSQCGARAMAAEGYSYGDILKYYYQGMDVGRVK